ncbi:unnamed protein product, partial [Coregonus sp. 'balchen']
MDGGSKGPRGQLLHLDVCVDEQKPRSGVLELLGRLRPQWKPQDIKMKVFTEGITNQLMGCFVGSLQELGAVLVRVYGRMTELYVDREREVEMFKILHSHNCGPQIYCSFQNGICYEFVRGTVLIATEMGKIHSIKLESDPVENILWKKMAQFLKLVHNAQSNTPAPHSACERVSSEETGERGSRKRLHLQKSSSVRVRQSPAGVGGRGEEGENRRGDTSVVLRRGGKRAEQERSRGQSRTGENMRGEKSRKGETQLHYSSEESAEAGESSLLLCSKPSC